MGKRAAVVFTCLAVVVLQHLWSDAEPPRFYLAAPPMLAQSPMTAFQPRVPSPYMQPPDSRIVDQDWTSQWNYDTPFTQDEVERRVIERLFRKPPPALDDPSKDAALQAAAQEVRDIAATFGKPEGDFANKWVAKVMATEDPKARLDIIDECFVNMELDCQGLEDALRRFRMLLAPHTALVMEAKGEVLFQAGKQDGMKKAFVVDWMRKVDNGQKATEPSDVLDECLIANAMGGARSKECHEFEEALRNYKAAAELWTKDAPPSKALGNRLTSDVRSAAKSVD
jgi:hypothetical protein